MKLMVRLPGWRERFSATIEAVRAKPFSWGTHDCATGLAGPCIKAITGKDLARGFRRKYTTPKGALKTLRQKGFRDLAAFAAQSLPEIPPAMAVTGDVVALKTPETGWGFGVVLGERIAVLTPDGLGTLDRSKAERAFKVG